MGKYIKYFFGGILVLLGIFTHSEGFSKLGHKLLEKQSEQ